MSRKSDKKKAVQLRSSSRGAAKLPGSSTSKTQRSDSSRVGREQEMVGSELAAWQFYVALVVLALVTLWSYWPTIVWMEDQWRNEPDYSHGYLVAPLAGLILYIRRDMFPGLSGRLCWGGISLLLFSIVLRIAGRLAYLDFLDGWTLALWIAGIFWLFAGTRVLVWALPAIGFLLLAVPMPFRLESGLSWQLQGAATTLSVAFLQVFGFPAISEGHTIWLENRQSLVEEACSGLRIFVGMGAMGYLFAVLARRAWLDRIVILASALPIAIFVNMLRVSGTVLAYHWLSESNAQIAHDSFGVMMIIIGALLLAGVKSFWERLYRPVDASIGRFRSAVV